MKWIYRQPDNWHGHVREGKLMRVVLPYFNFYGRLLCMGNTKELVETPVQALRYRKEVGQQGAKFEPVPCIMLTNNTTPNLVYLAHEAGIKFVKFIPVGTSTGASKGLRLDDFDRLFRILPVIAECGMHFLVHCELLDEGDPDSLIAYIDREDRGLPCIMKYSSIVPDLNITIEHASTAKAINYVRSCNDGRVAATLTPQHAILIYDRVFGNNPLKPKFPYNFCLPVAKTEADRRAVEKAMISGDERFFAGSDAAPHWITDKEKKMPNAGVFFGDSELIRYFLIFAQNGAEEKFQGFMSEYGARRYGFPLNEGTITIEDREWQTPLEKDGLRFCLGGQILPFRVTEINGKPIE